ncbi:hypothetical protein [Burkholderia ubonensis]|uniref:hypothetical protein n=1 Tax=Burkholderia ubonensis TaxID=101571 RepID=UPI000AA557C1|nr:hypothetical protein [Burkholderia ubonensis]
MDQNIVYAESEISSQPAAFNPNYDYDSGWHLTDKTINRNLLFTHRLGVAPSVIAIFFSPDQEHLYPLIWPWQYQWSGNPVSILVTTTAITLSIWDGKEEADGSPLRPLHGAWDGQSRSWTFWNMGYFRVFASR